MKLPTASKGRSSILKTTKEAVMSFLEVPDIINCKSGRKDTVYCRKDSNGEKIFKPRHYDLWTYKEIVGLYNSENELQITYYTIQKIVSEEKHFLSASSTPEDGSRCEKCENLELLLHSVKK